MKIYAARPIMGVVAAVAGIVLVCTTRQGRWMQAEREGETLSHQANKSSLVLANFTKITSPKMHECLDDCKNASRLNATTEASAAAAADTSQAVRSPPAGEPEAQRQRRRSHKNNITLIVQLRGELGNQLLVLAGARITQLIAAQKYPHLRIRLIGQHQNAGKWVRGRDDLVRCFPEFRDFVFEGGTFDPDFRPVEAMQKAWLNETEQGMLTSARESGLEFLQRLLEQQEQGVAGTPPPTTTDSNYSLPFLVENSIETWREALKSEYFYNDLRHWMRFNESACCAATPDSTEIVLHFRNYREELKRKDLRKFFAEATPETMANHVFRNASVGSRIAITTRFTRGLPPYIDSLKAKGVEARLIEGHTGVQDFCFMMKAQTELVGTEMSSFVRWASFLGNATINRFYTLDQSPNQTHPQPVQTMEEIRHGHRSFIMEEYWQRSEY